MGIYPIKDEAAHTRALRRIEALMDAESLTPEQGHELDALATLVEAYEEKNFAIREASPIAVIEFMMDQNGLTRKDLEPMIGSRARVSEVLSGKRPLTLAMIRALSNAWSISGYCCWARRSGRSIGAQGERRTLRARCRREVRGG